MITVSGASLVRGGRLLVHEIDTAFAPGMLTVVVGPNGAGKTSLMRLLTGEVAPAVGRIELDGRRLDSYSVTELARRRAVLPQSSHLSFPFTVLEVVRLAYSAGMPRDGGGDRRALDTLIDVDLDGYASRPFQTLSGGEQQRAQLARVLCQLDAHRDAGKPQYLLLDEPISNLDIRHQIDIFRLVRGLVAEGVGVIAILHDLNIAAMFADRLVVMKNGTIAADGAPGQVMTDGMLETVFALPLRVSRLPSDDTPFVLPHSVGNRF